MKSVKDENYPLIDTTWVFTQKVMASGKTKEKARLVARGFQDLGEGMTDTYSPTCSRNCLRLLLALCATEGWVPAVIDVTTAFLQGKPIERDVYLRPPKEAMEDSDRVWKLLVTVYGLCDAQRAWYDTVKEFFSSIRGRRMLREAAVLGGRISRIHQKPYP